MLLSLWTSSLAIIAARCSALLSSSTSTPLVARRERHAPKSGACGGLGLGLGLHPNSRAEEWEGGASDAILGGMDGVEVLGSRGGTAIANPIESIRTGFRQRRAADPNFLGKSILEMVLAASTQYAAEVAKRGRSRVLPEIDFVFAGILTAVFGKYYSMWRVARTASEGDDSSSTAAAGSWRDRVPTNSFQPLLLDGTAPTLGGRCLAFLLPMPPLFRAGIIASTVGYGLTSVLIRVRTMVRPSYVSPTHPVSVPLAAVYTGAFMALVSNVRYQLLQGIVEPYFIEAPFDRVGSALSENGRKRQWTAALAGKLKYVVIFLVRLANGLLGSYIAISGMKAFGLQKLR